MLQKPARKKKRKSTNRGRYEGGQLAQSIHMHDHAHCASQTGFTVEGAGEADSPEQEEKKIADFVAYIEVRLAR